MSDTAACLHSWPNAHSNVFGNISNANDLAGLSVEPQGQNHGDIRIVNPGAIDK